MDPPCARWSAYLSVAKDQLFTVCDDNVYFSATGFMSAYWVNTLSASFFQYPIVTLGNFDGDPNPDMIAVNPRGGTIAYGSRIGGFERGWGITLSRDAGATQPASFARGHFGDGNLLVGSDRSLSAVAPGADLPRATVLLHNAAPANFEIVSVAACDVDGDGSDDALVLWQPTVQGGGRKGLLQLFYGRHGSLEEGEHIEVIAPDPYSGSRVLGVDLDGDGRCEPVVESADRQADGKIYTTTFARMNGELTARVLSFGQGLGEPADLDGDGDVDFYYPQQLAHGIVYFLNDGHGQFTQGSMDITVNAPGTTAPLFLYDIEIAPGKAGALEAWAIATASRGIPEGQPYFLIHGAFALGAPLTAVQFSAGRLFGWDARIVRGDVNGDGIADVMVSGDEDGLRIFASSASGELVSAATYYGWPDRPQQFYDANADGLPDVIFSTVARPGTLRVLTTKGE